MQSFPFYRQFLSYNTFDVQSHRGRRLQKVAVAAVSLTDLNLNSCSLALRSCTLVALAIISVL